MADKLLITQDEIKTIALNQQKFDKGLITDSAIMAASNKYIKPVLTDDLYKEVVAQNNNDTLTPENETLLNDYVKNSLAYFVVYMVLPQMQMKISNIGIQINSTEFGSSASSAQRTEISDSFYNIAESFADVTKDFLDDNTTTYPLYDKGDSIGAKTTMVGGIVIPKKSNCNCDINNSNYCNCNY